MNQQERKEAVLEWIQSGCNYDQGVQLYSLFGKNNFLRKDFVGKQHKYSTKIIYELCKSIGLDFVQLKSEKLIPVLQETPIVELPSTASSVRLSAHAEGSGSIASISTSEPEGSPEHLSQRLVEGMPELLSDNNIAEYPAIIRRIITEYAELFQERSKTHRILTEMPPGNSQALKTKRAEIFDLVKAFTVRLEYLFNVRQQFEKDGTCPTEDEVWPAPNELPETTLSDDPEELRKIKKNQQTANTKDQNMLDFQTMVKGSEKKTMPSGPKRTRIENRIKGRLKFIQEIDSKLVSIDVN